MACYIDVVAFIMVSRQFRQLDLGLFPKFSIVPWRKILPFWELP